MKRYCYECGQEVDVNTITRTETIDVIGEPIEVEARVLVCKRCGEDLFDEELDNATLVDAYNEYRKRHKLLLPDEIKRIREQYGLSQRSFARLLNWGEKTICRYENGSIQDKAHNSMLLFLRDPDNMKTYLTENEVTLGKRQMNKLLTKVEELEQREEKDYSRVISAHFPHTACEDNGFRVFDFDKFCAMVIYFANNTPCLLKTKLMKLLHYSDNLFYKENGISISGASYVHAPYGPVPKCFDLLLEEMAQDGLAHQDITYDDKYERHQIIPDEEMPFGILSEDELRVMERVNKRFAHYGSSAISEYSHKEVGYTSTSQGEIISYAFAKDLSI